MRTLVAATAALSAALLLGACAGPDTVEPAQEASTTPAASAETGGVVEADVTCAGYYDGGELSVHHRVTVATEDVAEPATEENLADLTIISDRINAQLRYADDAPAALLEDIQAPFTASLEGESGDPAAVESAAAAFETLCVDAGFAVPTED